MEGPIFTMAVVGLKKPTHVPMFLRSTPTLASSANQYLVRI